MKTKEHWMLNYGKMPECLYSKQEIKAYFADGGFEQAPAYIFEDNFVPRGNPFLDLVAWRRG